MIDVSKDSCDVKSGLYSQLAAQKKKKHVKRQSRASAQAEMAVEAATTLRSFGSLSRSLGQSEAKGAKGATSQPKEPQVGRKSAQSDPSNDRMRPGRKC